MKITFLQKYNIAKEITKVTNNVDKNIWNSILEILNYSFSIGDNIKFTVASIIIIIITFIITKYALIAITNLTSKRLTNENKIKFKSLFSFIKYFIYGIVGLVVFQSLGINLTPVLAASTALLVGVGLALQTLFQDIISGVFILIDQTVKVGDIIELDNKVGRVEEIKLRTTRAVTFDDKVLIIPNHQYLSNSLYNWTQNGNGTRDSITLGVAYGSDTQLVKKILMDAAMSIESVLKDPSPIVFFEDFSKNSLKFKLYYSINDSFYRAAPKSELYFKIDALFRENKISIPFPQLVVHRPKELIKS